MPRKPNMKPVESMRLFFGEDYYICRFQEPGKIEAEIAHFRTSKMLKKIIFGRKPGPLACLKIMLLVSIQITRLPYHLGSRKKI
ncbi:hypothetical protein CRYUN_Cryun05aG0009000 [Craigia yunnanensis]